MKRLTCALVLVSACNEPFLRGIEDRKPPNDVACSLDAPVTELDALAVDGGVRLTWASEATNADEVRIYRTEADPIDWEYVIGLSPDTTLHNDYGARDNRQYIYRATNYKKIGTVECESAASNEERVTTFPLPVSGLDLTTLSAAEVELSWQDDNIFHDGYRIERQADGEGYALLTEPTASVSAYLDDTIEEGHVYDYRVAVFNSSGTSTWVSASHDRLQSPILAWTEPPSITDSCTLEAAGTATFPGAAGFGSAEAEATNLDTAHAYGATGSNNGISVALDDLTPGPLFSSWTVEDELGVRSRIQRDLLLNASPTSRSVTRLPTTALGDDNVPGRQALLPGCSDCQGLRGSVSAGNDFTCVTTSTGRVACWGYDRGAAARGQLGEIWWPVPACNGGVGDPCASRLAAVDVVVGANGHTCVRNELGEVSCWGDNNWGQLGDGSDTTRAEPVPVCTSGTGPDCTKLSGVREIGLGDYSTCGRLDSQQVVCWGNNTYGELGGGVEGGWSPHPVTVCLTGSHGGADCVPLAGVTSITVGPRHACAVRGANDGVVCWGHGNDGQLGDGSTLTAAANPVEVTDDTAASIDGVAEVVVGRYHTCARLEADGSVLCWGDNYYRALGNGGALDQPYPTAVCATGTAGTCTPFTGATQIAAGDYHNCALLGDEVHCWGYNNSHQLGIGANDPDRLANPTPACASGTGIGCVAHTGVARIDAGEDNTCAVMQLTGEVTCWGDNTYGELGVGHDSDVLVPTSMCAGEGDPCPRMNDVALARPGGYHTCLLIQGTGEVWCVGDNRYAELGLSLLPYQTHALDACRAGFGASCEPLEDVVQLATGARHACAVLESGEITCWGQGNDYGELGRGTLDAPSLAAPPSAVCATGSVELDCAPLQGVIAVAAGGRSQGDIFEPPVSHTCAILEDSSVRCWGDNRHGQLGINVTLPDQATPCPCVPGYMCDNSICILEPEPNPVQVLCGQGSSQACEMAEPLVGAVAVAVGGEHSCVLLNDGTVRCWGYNGSEQRLGSSVGNAQSFPIEVPDLAGAVAVVAGLEHTCALVASGEVWCWGSNAAGQLGDGTQTDRAIPIKVCAAGAGSACPKLGGVTAIAAGGFHNCALMDDGAVRCWGDNEFGQLGDGTCGEDVVCNSPVRFRPIPQSVCAHDPTNDCSAPCTTGGLGGAVAITAGRGHSCALFASGGVSCWGDGTWGQMGNGKSSDYFCTASLGTCVGGSGTCGSTYLREDYAVRTCEVATIEVAP